MSFILEALRKSEAERRAVPTTKGVAAGIYVVSPARRGSPMTRLVPLAAVAAGIGLVLGWSALSSLPSPLPWASFAPVAPVAGGAAPDGSPPLQSAREMTAAATVGSATAVPASERIKVQAPAAVTVARPPVKTVVVASAATAAVGAKAARPAAIAPGMAPTEPHAAVKATAAPAVAVPPVTSGPSLALAAPATVTASMADSAAAPPVAAPPVAAPAMAPSVADDEPPKLMVSGFANSDDTRARFAVIDNRIVREGEAFAPDMRLVQVGDDGVVVEYKGRRYRP